MSQSGVSPIIMKKLLKCEGIKSESDHEDFVDSYQDKIDAHHK